MLPKLAGVSSGSTRLLTQSNISAARKKKVPLPIAFIRSWILFSTTTEGEPSSGDGEVLVGERSRTLASFSLC